MSTFPEVEPGIYYDLPAEDYFRVEAVSASILKALHGSSPAHVKAQSAIPSEAMEKGSALHCLCLDDKGDFDKRYFGRRVIDQRTQEYKIREALIVELNKCQDDEERMMAVSAALNPPKKKGKKVKTPYTLIPEHIPEIAAEADALKAGKIPLALAEMDEIRTAAAALRAHPFAAPMLADSKKEVSLFWMDDDIGLCKARFDMLTPRGVIGDLKSTRSADPEFFRREIAWNRKYWIQAAWYYRGACTLGLSIEEFVFIALELSAPFGVTLHVMDAAELQSLQKKVAPLAVQWAQCLQSGVYPSYPPIRHIITMGTEEGNDDAA